MSKSAEPRKIDARYVADLARIEITDEEAERYGKQLDDVLEYVELLQKLKIDHIEPTAHATPRHNVTRLDQTEPSMHRKQMLANAPATAENKFIRVPAVIEDEENS